jgi:hypothetical protein
MPQGYLCRNALDLTINQNHPQPGEYIGLRLVSLSSQSPP